MPWAVILVAEVEEWFLGLDAPTAALVAAAIDRLEDRARAEPRPLADRLRGSRLRMKVLRPGSAGSSSAGWQASTARRGREGHGNRPQLA